MSFIIFIILLALLILIHECGHFLAAKSVDARVDEFGIGFPPRLYAWQPKNSETTYSINWIPFGGFVKILGENGDDETILDDRDRSLTTKAYWKQAWVLSAGVIFNTIFAWLIIAIGFMAGFPSVITPETQGVVGTPVVTVLGVSPDSPAAQAGLKAGDVIVRLAADRTVSAATDATSVETVQDFIGDPGRKSVTLTILRKGETEVVDVVPEPGIISGRHAIGISMDLVGTVRLSFFKAFVQSGKTTWHLLSSTASGLWHLLTGALSGSADFSQVSGPVGIVGMVGDAAREGFLTLLSFAAVISLNLAIINLVPFPALDGGRLLFILIEAVIRRPLPHKVINWANGIGFSLLILLMVVITVHDVIKLF